MKGPTELTVGWSAGALHEVLGAHSSKHREVMNPRVPTPAHARVQHLSQAWGWGICEMVLRLKVKCTR